MYDQPPTQYCQNCGEKLIYVPHVEWNGEIGVDEPYFDCPSGCAYPTCKDEELTPEELKERGKVDTNTEFGIAQIKEDVNMKTPQELQFELMKLASFNEFDGNQVVRDLKANPDLWRGAIMDRASYPRTGEKFEMCIDLIKLRDVADGWNVDTLFITPAKGKEDELEKLAKTWKADEVDWYGGEQVANWIGSWSPETRTNPKQLLRIWWD